MGRKSLGQSGQSKQSFQSYIEEGSQVEELWTVPELYRAEQRKLVTDEEVRGGSVSWKCEEVRGGTGDINLSDQDRVEGDSEKDIGDGVSGYLTLLHYLISC